MKVAVTFSSGMVLDMSPGVISTGTPPNKETCKIKMQMRKLNTNTYITSTHSLQQQFEVCLLVLHEGLVGLGVELVGAVAEVEAVVQVLVVCLVRHRGLVADLGAGQQRGLVVVHQQTQRPPVTPRHEYSVTKGVNITMCTDQLVVQFSIWTP